MFEDDLAPKKTGDFKNLENMSVADLKEYIEELRAEIARAEADIIKKKAAAEAAEAFFKG